MLTDRELMDIAERYSFTHVPPIVLESLNGGVRQFVESLMRAVSTFTDYGNRMNVSMDDALDAISFLERNTSANRTVLVLDDNSVSSFTSMNSELDDPSFLDDSEDQVRSDTPSDETEDSEGDSYSEGAVASSSKSEDNEEEQEDIEDIIDLSDLMNPNYDLIGLPKELKELNTIISFSSFISILNTCSQSRLFKLDAFNTIRKYVEDQIDLSFLTGVPGSESECLLKGEYQGLKLPFGIICLMAKHEEERVALQTQLTTALQQNHLAEAFRTEQIHSRQLMETLEKFIALTSTSGESHPPESESSEASNEQASYEQLLAKLRRTETDLERTKRLLTTCERQLEEEKKQNRQLRASMEAVREANIKIMEVTDSLGEAHSPPSKRLRAPNVVTTSSSSSSHALASTPFSNVLLDQF